MNLERMAMNLLIFTGCVLIAIGQFVIGGVLVLTVLEYFDQRR